MTNAEGTQIFNTAYARGSDKKSGMDDAQLTGSVSSYARKIALNGLFLIDDTKDADSDELDNQITGNISKEEKEKADKLKEVEKLINKAKNQEELTALWREHQYVYPKVKELVSQKAKKEGWNSK